MAANQPAEADLVLAPVLEKLADRDPAVVRRYIGDLGLGLSGIGGIARLFEYRSDAEPDGGSWQERSERVIDALTDELISAAPATDLLSGIAGLGAPVASFHRRPPTASSARVLAAVGRLLLDRQNIGGGWPLAPGHPSLAGLSHGAGGIALALCEIADALGDERFMAGAVRALEFEARLFDPIARNWPDLRRELAPHNRLVMRSWCHGSVGVALTRLRILELLGDHEQAPVWRSEVELAVESSITAAPTEVDHLCCGNLGRASVISLVGQMTNNEGWQRRGRQLTADVVARAANSPDGYRLLLGIDGTTGLRLPGLMTTGLAGVGLSLLHGEDLNWVRSLLL